MTPDQKLARIVRSLKDAGIDALVMGGHAVRYYGIDRNTVDFDLVTSLSTTDELRLQLPRIESLGPIREEPVWRSGDFARFEIGRLPDARYHAGISSAPDGLLRLLSDLRSRRGMDRAIEEHLLEDHDTLVKALAACAHPVTCAFLIPVAGTASPALSLEPSALAALSTVGFGSPKHFALIEICRRAHKRRAMEADRADKQAKLNQRR